MSTSNFYEPLKILCGVVVAVMSWTWMVEVEVEGEGELEVVVDLSWVGGGVMVSGVMKKAGVLT